MLFFSRFASGRRTRFAARAAFALGAAVAFPDVKQAGAAGEVPEIGIWIDHEGKGAIEIKTCGPALCGNIVWVKNPVNDQGEPLFDRRNPDETKRNRPICGLPVIGNLRRMPDGWDEGWIYSPEEGSQYDLALKAASKDKLTVTGYKGVKLFSKTFTWTRAPADFQRCGAATESKAKPAVPPTAKVAVPKPVQPSGASTAKPATANATASPAAIKPPAAKPSVAKAAPTGQPNAKPAAQPVAKTATAPLVKKPVAKDAAAKAPAAAQPVKKAAVAPAAKPGEKQQAGTQPPAVQKKQAAKPLPADAKKTAATEPGAVKAVVPPKPTAAKKPATAASAAAQPAEKKAVPKKQTAEEAEASSAE